MKRLKKFIDDFLHLSIFVSLTSWLRFVFEANNFSAEYCFYRTYLGIGITLPLFSFEFRVLQDSHRDAKFNPVLRFETKLWKLRLFLEDWHVHVGKGVYKSKRGLACTWNRKTLFNFKPASKPIEEDAWL